MTQHPVPYGAPPPRPHGRPPQPPAGAARSGGDGAAVGTAVALGCGTPLVIGCGIVMAVVAVIVVVALVIVWAVNDALQEAGVTGDPASPTARATVYALSERPGYDEMREHVEGMSDKYSAMVDDGSIWDVAPHGRDTNPEYVRFFEYLLFDQAAALRFTSETSTDPDELDQIIAELRSRPDAYEASFLAGEPLSSPWFTQDGEVIVVEAKTAAGGGQEAPAPPEDPVQGLGAIEEAIAAYEARLGADGTYKDAAAEIAALAAMDVSYDQQAIYQYCTRNPRDDGSSSVAMFCAGDPGTVYVSWDNSMYPEFASDPAFDDSIRHEVAHRLIYERCGTTAPPIAGSVYEGVTNSYTLLYLGGEFDSLQHTDPADPYHMNDETEEIARAIHAGTCA